MLQKAHLNKRKTNVGLKIRKYMHSQWKEMTILQHIVMQYYASQVCQENSTLFANVGLKTLVVMYNFNEIYRIHDVLIHLIQQ